MRIRTTTAGSGCITEGDVGYFRNTEIISTSQPDTGNTVILQEVKRLVERLSAVVGAAEAPSAQVVREEEDYGNTVLPEMARTVHLADEGTPVDENVAIAAETTAQPLADISNFDNTVIQEKVASRRSGRPSTKREPILNLLREHSEGLSAEQIRGLLNPEKPIGDTLQGLRRGNLVRTEGSGREMRYFLAGEG